MKTFYVQADFVEQQLVNNTSMKLLYVAQDHNSNEFVMIPYKLNLNCSWLSSARFWITDENNEAIRFVDGKPVIQMQFVHK